MDVDAWIVAVGAATATTGGYTYTHVDPMDTMENGAVRNTPPRSRSCDRDDVAEDPTVVLSGQMTSLDHGLCGTTPAPGPRYTSSCRADLYEHHAVCPCAPVVLEANTL